MEADQNLTMLLDAAATGDGTAAERLLPLVYDHLRRLARARMANERVGHTLDATGLVHEAYLRLVGGQGQRFENRAHFFGAAAIAMRRILVERARERAQLKRGGGRERVPLDEALRIDEDDPVQTLALDEAMTRLEARDARKARVVMLRYFAGLSVEETAEAMGLSETTVKAEWAFARAWLRRELDGGEA
ncbi:MAG TPA: ECF-type sigma factor [Phycisphaerales bacterium]|nr:ECF-type sigma factor [Phycisphaerales bacterium]